MKIDLPFQIGTTLDMLHSNGHEAFVGGGCVRDCLLNKSPKDWDVTTSAKPETVIAIFASAGLKTIPTGIKHGTVTVLSENEPVEITTYRIDGEYLDGRRPENVEFTASINDDLSRRDFTINSMAYNDVQGLIDPFGGLEALNKKVIECVGNAEKRFKEDALRMLRAVRFSAQLGFDIENNTLQAIRENSSMITYVSKERIRDELNKIVLSRPEKVMLLYDAGLLKHILPEFEQCLFVSQDNSYHIYDVAGHILKAAENIEEDLILRLTMLLHDIGKPKRKTIDKNGVGHFYGHPEASARMTVKRLRELRYDNC